MSKGKHYQTGKYNNNNNNTDWLKCAAEATGADLWRREAWFKQLLSLKAWDDASITERGCEPCRTDEGQGEWWRQADSTAYHHANPTPYSLTLPFCSLTLSVSLMCSSYFPVSLLQRTIDVCLSFPNSSRHSISLSRQIIRIRAPTLPVPSDADRLQWLSVGTRKWAPDR